MVGNESRPGETNDSFEKACEDARNGLKPGGPPVQMEKLYAYIDNDLPKDDFAEVTERIRTWKTWFEAYLEIRQDIACNELRETNPNVGESDNNGIRD
jgi:hypothetical protein